MLSDDGFHVGVMRMADGVPMRTAKDYENYTSRLRAIPEYFRQNVANMRLGMREGFTLPSQILPGMRAVIDGQQWTKAEETPLWAPFVAMDPVALARGAGATAREREGCDRVRRDPGVP